MNWVRRFSVRGSQGDPYTVAISDTGHWGCSCPKWKFARKGRDGLKPDCHHIMGVQAGMPRQSPRPAARPAPRTPAPSRFSGLDLDEQRAVAALPIGTRFRYLDLDMTVTE